MAKKLEYLYRLRKPGECPNCHKGPVIVMVRDTYPVVIDNDGYAVTLGDVSNVAYGICSNCGKKLGKYELDLFKWRPANFPKVDNNKTIKPSINFFGNTGDAKVIYPN